MPTCSQMSCGSLLKCASASLIERTVGSSSHMGAADSPPADELDRDLVPPTKSRIHCGIASQSPTPSVSTSNGSPVRQSRPGEAGDGTIT